MARICLWTSKPSNALGIVGQHLVGMGHTLNHDFPADSDAIVCWGRSHSKGPKPVLNGQVNKYDKWSCFEQWVQAGVPCPTIVDANPELGPGVWPEFNGVWLARKRHHTRGRDIRVCSTRKEVLDKYYKYHPDFFSIFIPTQTEYRAWVWRKRVLSVQEKVFKGPGEFKGYVRNHRFGFHFQKRDELREDPRIVKPAVGAVKALELDFGAVDLLEGKDGKVYMLEVNSMPAIDSPKRSSGIRLAAAISRWVGDHT